MNCPAKFPCSAASLLCPFRVARVSRLIGNSHTTVNSFGWQEYFEALTLTTPTWAQSPNVELKTLQTQETPLDKSGVSLSCACHWPPKKFVVGSIFRRTSSRLPDRSASIQGPLRWRLLLPGSFSSLGWSVFFSAPIHHWHPTYSNRWASQTSV